MVWIEYFGLFKNRGEKMVVKRNFEKMKMGIKKEKGVKRKRKKGKEKISLAAFMKEPKQVVLKNRIYMDHGASTPVRKEVLKVMLPYFSEKYGNASSLHLFGREAAQALEESRKIIATAIGARSEEIIFTSGGTESDNLAIKGIAFANGRKTGHIITSLIEHPAVMATCRYLERKGYMVTYLPVDSDGQVSVADVRANITDETILVTIMHANNEIGTVQPVEGIARVCREKGVPFHTDAVQTFCKLPIDVHKMGIDMISLSSHKIYGPKGVGALYVKSGIKLEPTAHGGPHEMERRAGTENVAGIVGFATAAQLAMKEMPKEMKRQTKLRDKLIEEVMEQVKGMKLNGSARNRLPNNVNFSFVGLEGESLVLRLDQARIATSTGSACSSKKLEPSHVLLALGLTPESAHGSLRITIGRDNSEKDVKHLIGILPRIVRDLREISPTSMKIGLEEEENASSKKE